MADDNIIALLKRVNDMEAKILSLEQRDHINTNPLVLPDDLYLKADDSHIYFGVADDVNLYRGAAQTLKTDSKFIVSRTISGAGGKDVISTLLTSYVSGESGPVFGLQVSSVMGGAIGGVTEGGGWTGALLFYSHVNVADNTIGSGVVEGMRLDSSQVLWIGSGAGKDTNLHRGGANWLRTDDSFSVMGGVYDAGFLCGLSSPDSGQLFYGTDNSGWKFHIGKQVGGSFTAQMTFQDNGCIGISDSTPGARLDINQNNSSAAYPVLELNQADIDDVFINFVGTSAADNTRSITTKTASWTHVGGVRVEINGTQYWIPMYSVA